MFDVLRLIYLIRNKMIPMPMDLCFCVHAYGDLCWGTCMSPCVVAVFSNISVIKSLILKISQCCDTGVLTHLSHIDQSALRYRGPHTFES